MQITIRHCEKADIESVKALYEQPSCFAATTELPFSSVSKWVKQFEQRPENFYSLVAEFEGEIIGEIAMQVYSSPRRQHAATMGMAISESFQGQGIGSKLLNAIIELANNWLALTRIELEVYTDNEAAIQLYQKHGFVVEGKARAFAFRNGHYVDAYLMARVSTP